jgi:hypothetical protein
MNLSFVTIKWNTGHTNYYVVNENWLVLDWTPERNLGLAPDYEALVKHIPYEVPNYDPRIHRLNIIREYINEPHPTYPQFKQFRVTYELEKKTNEEIKLQIESYKNMANEIAFPYQKQLESTVIAINALRKAIMGINLLPIEEQLLRRVSKYANVIFANRNNEINLCDVVDQGGEPNCDEGWTEQVEEDEV